MSCILALVDFSDVTPAVVQRAAELGRALHRTVYLLHVAAPAPEFVGYEPGPQSVRDTVAGQIRKEHGEIQRMEAELKSSGLDVQALLVQGPTVEKILSEADRLKADMMVAGSHGRGALHHLLVGSVTEGLLRKVRCPLVVVPRPSS